MPAMALTDFSNLCGLVKFYNTANNVGVKPIIGQILTFNLTRLVMSYVS